jgi:hypothetical protein
MALDWNLQGSRSRAIPRTWKATKETETQIDGKARILIKL